ncbi:hypothetical protein Cantr_07059 [Candida viswanathii]|uniref:triacylglycerol lipase n=1 Tax=Candida viswanathii TaxID=5486 RepID=A0A367Y2W5_9ASCO|nr:hypothetical protein Cantr_07059 [Candida viswanathii]
MLVEEVPKSTNANTSTIYFSSSINLTARLLGKSNAGGDATNGATNKKGRAKVNYNLNQLMNAQTQVNEPTTKSGALKSTQQVQLERLVSKRLVDLTHETSTKGFELPKNFTYTSIHAKGSEKVSHKSRLGNTPTTKRILAARRNLNLYFEEERNLISINTILGLNYQFVDFTDVDKNKRRKVERIRPKVRLCCISGKPNKPEAPAKDYIKLVEFSNFAAVGYCVNRGLAKGRLGDEDSNCALLACKNDFLADVEIIKIFDFNRLNEVGTGYYALDRKRKAIILVFRGSVSRRDWATDMDFIPTSYKPIVYEENFGCDPYILTECKNCRVHRGFYNFLKDNSAAIITEGIALKEEYPDYQFLIIGHSLGAALTMLSGIEFQLLGYDPLVVTYGGPKVGNQEFADFTDNLFDTDEVDNEIATNRDFSRGFIRVVHNCPMKNVIWTDEAWSTRGYLRDR